MIGTNRGPGRGPRVGRGAATLLLGVAALIGGCATPRSDQSRRADTAGQSPAGVSGTTADTAALARLEREAHAVARAEGCEQSDQCRTAPVGSRPCGGPRDYLVYCALTTDSAALFRKLVELERAEKAYNEQAGLMSTCEFRMPPAPELTGGVCRAGGATPP